MQQNELCDIARQTSMHIKTLLYDQQAQIISQKSIGLLIKHGDQIWKIVRIPEIIPLEYYQQLKVLAKLFNVIIDNKQNEITKLKYLQNSDIRYQVPRILENRQISFSMKYINLGSIEDLLCQVQGNLNTHTINWISFQLFQLINRFHNTLNLVHLDIKPENVMIEQYYELFYEHNDNTIELELNQGLVLILVKLYAGLEPEFINIKQLKSNKLIGQYQYEQIRRIQKSNFEEFIEAENEDFHHNCQDIFDRLFQNETQSNTVPLLNGNTILNAKSLISLIVTRFSRQHQIKPYAFKIQKKYKLILIDFQFSKSINDDENFGFGTKSYMAPEIASLVENQNLSSTFRTISESTPIFRYETSAYILRQQQMDSLNKIDLRKCDLFSYGMLLFNLKFYSNTMRPKYCESQLQYYDEVKRFLQNTVLDEIDPYPDLIFGMINTNPNFRPTYNQIYNFFQQLYQKVDQNQVFIEFHSQVRKKFQD